MAGYYSRGTTEQRFWARVTKGPDCWLWDTADTGGYGAIRHNGKSWKAHRFSYTLLVGPIPEGLHVCHKCDNTLCVNPDHLFVGTHGDNMRDMFRKGRRRLFRGERNRLAKMTKEGVLDMRNQYAAGGVSMMELAEQYDVNFATAQQIIRHHTWTHVGGPVATVPRRRPKDYAKGEKVGSAKLSDADVLAIRDSYVEGVLQRELAEWFGVSGTLISLIINRKRWDHI